VEQRLVGRSTIRLTVPHRGTSYAYPIAADPQFEWNDASRNIDWTPQSNWYQWKTYPQGTHRSMTVWWDYGSSPRRWDGNSFTYTYTKPASRRVAIKQAYWEGVTLRQWSTAVPVCFTPAIHSPTNGSNYGHGTRCGTVPQAQGETLPLQSAWVPANVDAWDARFDRATWTASFANTTGYQSYAAIGIPQSTITLYDKEPPNIAVLSAPPQNQWIDSGTITTSATDGGLGVSISTLMRPDGTYYPRTNISPNPPDCGDVYCPTRVDFATSVGDIEEGVREIRGRVVDRAHIDVVKPNMVNLKVDRSAPEETPSGRLWTSRDEPLHESSYGLTVNATDGSNDTNASRRSGVKSIEVLVDNERRFYEEQGCTADSCPMTRSWAFNTDDYSHGEHTIKTIVRDQLGHPTERSWKVNVDHRTGSMKHYGFESEMINDRASAEVNVANGNLLATGNDLQIKGTGLDLNLSRSYNSRGANTRKSDLGYGWEMSLGPEVDIAEVDGNTVRLHGPSGFMVDLDEESTSGGTTTYKTPRGLNAELRQTDDGRYTLTLDGNKQQFRFNENGRLLYTQDKNGRDITLNYETNGKVDTIKDTQGRLVDLGYNAAGLVERMQDSTGRQWLYGYDGNERLTSYTDPAGGVTEYGYDDRNRLTSITDPRDHTTTITYSGSTHSVATIVRDGATKQFAYDTSQETCNQAQEPRRTTTVTDARNNETDFCHDRHSQVDSVQDARGQRRSATYDSNGNIVEYANPGGGRSQANYSETTRNLESTSSSLGVTSSFDYGSSAHPHFATEHTDSQGQRSEFGYDGNGNLASVTRRDGQNAAQRLVSLDYNGTGDPQECEQSDNTGPEGTLRCSEDGNGHETLYRYDDRGNLTSVDPPGTQQGRTSYVTDALSRVTEITDGKNQRRTMAYDALDRVTLVRVYRTDGSLEAEVSYAYDGNGNRTTHTDPTGTRTMTFDARNRLTREDRPGAQTNRYAYDPVGNLVSFTDSGGTVQYFYDVVNRVTDVREPGADGQPDPNRTTTYGYDDDNNRTRADYPNGSSQSWNYDGDERIEQVVGRDATNEAILHLEWSYEDGQGQTGLRHRMTDVRRNRRTAYTYDHLNRMTRAHTTSTVTSETLENHEYDYDPNSNRLEERVENGNTTVYDYNEANEMATSGPPSDPSDVSYSYDANGNLVSSSSGLSIEYNARNQAVEIDPPGNDPVELTYAGADQNERLSKGDTTFGNTLLGVSSERTGGVSRHYTRDPRGALVGIRRNDGQTTEHSYFLTDSLGSVMALTGADGSANARFEYEPFGTGHRTDGTADSAFRFAGGYWDADLGYYKLGYRYMDPAVGRFTQNDPYVGFVDPRRANRYIYSGDDPVNRVDPTGLTDIGDIVPPIVGCAIGLPAGGLGCNTGMWFFGLTDDTAQNDTGGERIPWWLEPQAPLLPLVFLDPSAAPPLYELP
jgi:RHS repeat-associated protein